MVLLLFTGMIVSVGMSNLQFVDLNSNRNLFIIGVSILFGLALPQWFDTKENALNTGKPAVCSLATSKVPFSWFACLTFCIGLYVWTEQYRQYLNSFIVNKMK